MTRKKLADLLREEQGKNTEPSATVEEEVIETPASSGVETLRQEIAQLREQLGKSEQEKKAAQETATKALKELEKVHKEALELAKANTKLIAENATLTKEKSALPKAPETEPAPHWEQKPSRVVSKSLPPLVSHNNDNLPTWLL
jgi:septal ring factor EnvC (AmiA/AmiB activator)